MRFFRRRPAAVGASTNRQGVGGPGITPKRDGLVDLALAMSTNAQELMDEEGFHPPMYVLWPQDKRLEPITSLLDDSGPATIARWGTVIADAAAEARATTAVLIMEGWTADETADTRQAQEALIVVAANGNGHEVIIETPTASDDQGRRRATGERMVRPEGQEHSAFGPLRDLWRRSLTRPPGT